VQTNTFYDRVERRFYTVPTLNRQNPYQVKRLARRCLLQLVEENVNKYDLVSQGHVRAYKQTANRQGLRCRVLPQNDAPSIVLSVMGRHELPSDPSEKEPLIRSWIANIPKGKRIGGNRKFGGKHAGFRFTPKNPGRNIKVDLEMWIVEMMLDHDEVKYRWQDESDIVIEEMDKEKAEEYVREKLV